MDRCDDATSGYHLIWYAWSDETARRQVFIDVRLLNPTLKPNPKTQPRNPALTPSPKTLKPKPSPKI